ncbi:type VI secretion system protein TssL, long form [Ensifer adhaerens]|uniref:type VI secretion system protein TssL, long form n=1 Tax=Ensifer adhaerens TaxID=106592 RepID=UPI0038509961
MPNEETVIDSGADETVVMSISDVRASVPLYSPHTIPARAHTETGTALDEIWNSLVDGHAYSIVGAAAPLLDLCGVLRSGALHQDVEQFRLDVLREINKFETRLMPMGLRGSVVRASKYAVCATIDDLVLNTGWGGRSIWAKRSLVSTLFGETWGGDRFFEILTQLKREPSINTEVLELMYYCISLGFEGRYRIAERGISQLTVIREDLFRLLRSLQGNVERDISPHWRGAEAEPKHISRVSLLSVAAACVVLTACLYVALAVSLANRKIVVTEALAKLPPVGKVQITRVQPAPPNAGARVVVLQSERLRRFLEPEIEQGLVTVKEDARSITVLVKGNGMFESASATVFQNFIPLLLRVGEALNSQTGDVVVAGHTDSAPIRSKKFASNVALSLARANSVSAIIASRMREPARLRQEGRGDAEPIADNKSAAGRQLNRRIELIVAKELK